MFLTKSAGVIALGAVGCANDKSPFDPSSKTGSVAGFVSDSEGKGITDVKVVISGIDVTKKTVTDTSGKFSFQLSKNGEYTIYFSKTGYNLNPSTQKIVVANEKSFVVNVIGVINNTNPGIIKNTLGKTGIQVSKFGFGSHTLDPYTKNYQLRDYISREAIDRGINIFDVYDDCAGYANTGRYLAPYINDVVVSTYINAEESDPEKELDRIRTAFNKDCIDLIRTHIWTRDNKNWKNWETLFSLRDKGKIRAVGIPIHAVGVGTNINDGTVLPNDLGPVLEDYSNDLDFVVFPYNFYHNIGWPPEWHPEGWAPIAQILREKNIGVITMKPFAGDYYVSTLTQAAKTVNPDISFHQAALRFVQNSGINPDTSFVGMNSFNELLDNIEAFYDPIEKPGEKELLDSVRAVAAKTAPKVLPEHYKFLNSWAPKNVGGDPSVM